MTNTSGVDPVLMGELLHGVAGLGLAVPITLVLDNARCQRNAVVQGLGTRNLGISRLYLPSYSPNLNLIERGLEIHQTSRFSPVVDTIRPSPSFRPPSKRSSTVF